MNTNSSIAAADSPSAPDAEQDRHRQLCAMLPMGVFQADAMGACTFANPRWTELSGVAVGATFEEWAGRIHAGDRDSFCCEWDRSTKAVADLSCDFRLGAVESGNRWVRLTARPIRTVEGVYAGHVCAIEDITESRAVAERLRLQGAAVEAAANAIVITDRKGQIAWTNAAFTRLTGYDAAEVLGRNTRILKSGQHDDAYYANLWRTIAAGEVWHGEVVNRRKDGSHYMEEMSITPVRETSGEITNFIAIKQDVTARREAECRLAESEERFRALVENSMELFIQARLDGMVIYASPNHGEITGWKASELIGTSVFERVHPVDLPQALGTMRQKEGQMEVRYRFKDGSWHWLESTVRTFAVAGGGRHAVIVSRDVTERKAAEAAIAQARDAALESARIKSEFLANMSHEFRTPMNGVLGMLQLLLDTELAPPQRHFAVTACHSAESLLAVLNDVLDFSKIEARMLAIEETDFSPRDVVEGALELLAERAQGKKLELVCAVGDTVPSALRGDPTRLRQVLLNLVGNAIKFTDHGEVVVRVEAQRDPAGAVRLAFEVRDTGIGIAPEVIPKLFQAFTQADGSTTRKYGGTGLGLAITRRLIELMRGEIGVSSEVGRGSVFWFTLPIDDSRGDLP
ncbi:MAG: PAS domain S-box protein [Opitutaceae bacterium]|nr:PAS domain S-box protein [Opitutaceae bacterium]